MNNPILFRFNIKWLVALKSLTKNINNVITVKLALEFVNFLGDKGLLVQKQALYNEVKTTNPSKNGFDILCQKSQVVAEVKSSIPIKGGRVFGQQQQDSIENDLDALTGNNPRKANKYNVNPVDYYKFLVLYDDGKNRVKDAANQLISTYKSPNYPIVIWEPGTPITKSEVFVVIL